MPDKLLLHPATRQRLQDLAGNPVAAILITGPAGSGKKSIAKELAAQTLSVDTNRLADYPYFMHIRRPADKQEIPIEAVRRVVREMRLKPVISGQRLAKRVVLVEDAGSLSEEAQNAILKTLEEPSSDTLFILTTESETSLLPTVISRLQKMAITPVGQEEAVNYFAGSKPAEQVESAWQLSQGAPGLLNALLVNDAEHPLKIAVDEAKQFLQMSRYERAIYIDGLASDKPKLLEFLDALNRVLAALHHAMVKSGNQGQQRRITGARRLVHSAIESLSRNASPRLIGLRLALSLPV